MSLAGIPARGLWLEPIHQQNERRVRSFSEDRNRKGTRRSKRRHHLRDGVANVEGGAAVPRAGYKVGQIDQYRHRFRRGLAKWTMRSPGARYSFLDQTAFESDQRRWEKFPKESLDNFLIRALRGVCVASLLGYQNREREREPSLSTHIPRASQKCPSSTATSSSICNKLASRYFALDYQHATN